MHKPFNELNPATQAGILCNDPEFQKFAASRCGLPGRQFTSVAAAEYVRNCCQVASRKDIAENETASKRFEQLKTQFDVYRGRLAEPRGGF